MTAWQERALCKDKPRAYDFDYAILRAEPDAYVEVAGVCLSCPVRAECERWANAEARDNDGKGELGFIAAGYGYYRRGEHGRKLLARPCEGCGGVINANTVVPKTRFCSKACRDAA